MASRGRPQHVVWRRERCRICGIETWIAAWDVTLACPMQFTQDLQLPLRCPNSPTRNGFGLHSAVREVEELSSWFRRGGNLPVPLPANVPSPGFTQSVIVAARQLPTRDELLAQDFRDRIDEVDLVRCSRRISFAAAMVFGLAVLLFTTVRVQSDASRLEATSDELSQEMERLDEAFKAEFGGVGTRGR